MKNASDVKIEAEEKEKEEEDVDGKIHENFLPFQSNEASHDGVAHQLWGVKSISLFDRNLKFVYLWFDKQLFGLA